MSALIVAASLLATVAFQATITLAGGVSQYNLTEDANDQPVENPHKAGTAIMADNTTCALPKRATRPETKNVSEPGPEPRPGN